jgi:predicted O-methyltransferase YrrM
MDARLLAVLDELARFGRDNDARETERPRRMLNITPETGRLLWILVRQSRATRILEVGTSNAYSTIWLADAARETGGRVTTPWRNRRPPASFSAACRSAARRTIGARAPPCRAAR